MKSIKIILYLFFCFAVLDAYPQGEKGQEQPFEHIATPNATEIARYGDIPVSYYTGRANVNVPIFQASERDVPLDISLSYDTQGILAKSLPGWIGHNWVLNAGGVITRVKINLQDEYQSYSFPNFKNYFEDPGALKRYVAEYNRTKDLNELGKMNVCFGDSDTGADIFYFNFMGKAGRFFYGDDGQWKVLSDDNIHVEFDVNNSDNYIHPYLKYFNYERYEKQMKTIKGFTLIDDNGIRYIFGDNSNSSKETMGKYETRASAIEYSIPFFKAINIATKEKQDRLGFESMVASAWYLTEVQDRFGNSLYKFYYDRGKFIVQVNSVDERIIDEINALPTEIWKAKDYSLCLNSPVYLSKIIMPLSKDSLVFSLDNNRILTACDFYPEFCNSKLLDRLMREKIPTTRTTTDLLYFLQSNNDYVTPFQNKNTDKYNDPLSSMCINPLKNITIFSNGKLTKQFDFKYTAGDTRLFMTDIDIVNGNEHYGSYRFQYNNLDKLPREYLDISTDEWGYYNGESNAKYVYLPATKLGMLTRIFYPTGGLSELSYEQNKYESYFDKVEGVMKTMTGEAGGLRIKSIKNYEDSTKNILLSSRTFNYSGGELYSIPVHQWEWIPITGAVKVIVLNNNSIVPLANSFGPHIGYTTVTETDDEGNFTKYQYQNISDCMDEKPVVSMSSTPSPFDVFSDRGYKRGKLSCVNVYNKKHETLKTITYYYRTDDVEKDFVYNTSISMCSPTISATTTYYFGNIYKMYYPKYDVVKISENIRNGIGQDNTYVLTEYNKHDYDINVDGKIAKIRQCLSTVVTQGSCKMITKYSYPNFDYGDNSYLTSQFFLPVTSEKKYVDGQLVSGKKTIYKPFNGFYAPKYEITYGAFESAQDTVMTYMTYTPTYRPAEVMDRYGINHKYFWNERDKLVGIVDNGSSDVTFNSGNNVVSSSNPNEIFGTMPTNVEICSYDERGLISSITKQNGQATNYNYDSFSRLISVKDNDKNTLENFSYNYRPMVRNLDLVPKEDDEEYVPLKLYIFSVEQIEGTNSLRFNYEFKGKTQFASISIYSKSAIEQYHGPQNCIPLFSKEIQISDSRKGSIIDSVFSKDLQTGKYQAYLKLDGMSSYYGCFDFSFTRSPQTELISAVFNSSNKTVDVCYTLKNGVKSAYVEIVSCRTNREVLSSVLDITSSGNKSIDVSHLNSENYNIYLVVDGKRIGYKALYLSLPDSFPVFDGYIFLKNDTDNKKLTVYYQNVPSSSNIKIYKTSTIAEKHGVRAGDQYLQQYVTPVKGSVSFYYDTWPKDGYVIFLFVGGDDANDIKESRSFEVN